MHEDYYNHLIKKIYRIRKRKNLSKDETAKALGVSRATYIAIEKENSKRDLTIRELRSLADYFDMSLKELLGDDGDRKKFEQMYFYSLKFFKNGIPKTKLAKILYLADFKYYYSHRRPISGVNYIHRQYGPLAEDFLTLTDELYDDGKIRIKELEQGAFLIFSLVFQPDDNLLNEDEKKTIEIICKDWKNQSTAEIVNYTHEQKPWLETKNGDVIPYELILKEDRRHVSKPVYG